MDWLRRNWPDLLIGIALIAVIAGIVATLLTGGSFFPIGPGQGTAPVSTPNVAPATPPAGPGVVQDETPAVTPETPADSAVPTPDAGANQEGQPQVGANGGAVAVLPPAGDSAAPAPSEGAAQPADEPATPAAGAAQPEQATPAAAPAQPPASAAAPTAPYRVSVGAFGSEENAQGQAATFREAGFPVFLGRQGDLVLVLVGPYDTQQEAEQAVSRIRTGDFGIDPVIYRFQPDDATDPVATTPAATPTEEAASAPAPAPTETQAEAPAASADGSFLQVGAYGTRESALPQIERLEAMGFQVTERTESGLIKLLVGPFEGDALATARQQLQAEGIEHFAR